MITSYEKLRNVGDAEKIDWRNKKDKTNDELLWEIDGDSNELDQVDKGEAEKNVPEVSLINDPTLKEKKEIYDNTWWWFGSHEYVQGAQRSLGSF